MKRFAYVTMMVLAMVMVLMVSSACADEFYQEAQVGVVVSSRVSARAYADTRSDAVAKLTNGTRMCVIGKTMGYYDGVQDEFYIVTGDSIGLAGFGYAYVAADYDYLGKPEMVRMMKDTKAYAAPSRDCKAIAEISSNQERMVLEKLYVNGELWLSIQVDSDNRGVGLVPASEVSEIFYSTTDSQLEASYRGALSYTVAAQAEEVVVAAEEPAVEQTQVTEQQDATTVPVGGGNVVAGQNARVLAPFSVVYNGTTYNFAAGDVVYVWDVDAQGGHCKVVTNSKMVRVEVAYLTVAN